MTPLLKKKMPLTGPLHFTVKASMKSQIVIQMYEQGMFSTNSQMTPYENFPLRLRLYCAFLLITRCIIDCVHLSFQNISKESWNCEHI